MRCWLLCNLSESRFSVAFLPTYMVMINSLHASRYSAVNYNRSWQMQHATND